MALGMPSGPGLLTIFGGPKMPAWASDVVGGAEATVGGGAKSGAGFLLSNVVVGTDGSEGVLSTAGGGGGVATRSGVLDPEPLQ